MARASHVRERIFFAHSDPHGATPSHVRFLTGKVASGRDSALSESEFIKIKN